MSWFAVGYLVASTVSIFTASRSRVVRRYRWFRVLQWPGEYSVGIRFSLITDEWLIAPLPGLLIAFPRELFVRR